MAKNNNPEDAVKVAEVSPRKGVKVGKPRKIITSAMRMKTAYPASGGVTSGSGGNFYSPELSTDFLELPQSLDEQRNFVRFFFDHDPFVNRALTIRNVLPLSKIRLSRPSNVRNQEMADKALRFCENWSKDIRLLQRLMEIKHEWELIGETFVFCEDTSPDMPREIRDQPLREITSEGEIIEKWETYPDADEREVAWLKKNYKGWTAVRVLPPEQVHLESFPFTNEKLIELVPDSKTKSIIEKARQGDPRAQHIVSTMPVDIVESILSGGNLPLNTDPDAGSFCYYMARKKSPYAEHGASVLQPCLLPGTPIWIERNGIIQQVSVEDVNDQTDLLLTHKGRFMPCKAGSRPVNEDAAILTIEGIEDPLRVTADHKVLRVQEDGSEDWVEAKNLQPGDLVREAHVVPEAPPLTEIDLAAWWQDRTLEASKRWRPRLKLAETTRNLKVSDVATTATSLRVSFTYENDNRNRSRSLPGLEKLLLWATSLKEPLVLTQTQVAEAAGITDRDVRVYAPRLRKEGLLRSESLSLGRGKGKQVTWYPSTHTLPRCRTTFTSPVKQIPLNEDFCYLLGTWIGDGCVWTDDEFLNTHSIGWSLHDAALRERVTAKVETFFSGCVVQTGCLLDPTSESQDIRIEDPLLACWFKGEFGHKAQGKHLPRWVFDLPENHLLALMRGLLDTDGCLTVGCSSQIEFTLDNPILIDQMHLLCNRLGFKTQVGKHLQKAHSWKRGWQTKQGWKDKTYHYEDKTFPKLSCCNHDDVKRWVDGSVKDARVQWPDRNHAWESKFKEGWLTRKVEQIRKVPYVGLVYSFATEQDESHVTGGTTTHNCLRTLIFRDKVRQSLTSIASRHMTPYRLIYAEDMDDEQTEALREQVDMALQDPDYSIITSFQVNWEEMGADQRLPDWSWVFDLTDRQMYAGLGVTESLLSGEASYSGDKLNLEVINREFLLDREMIQELVEQMFYKPMCKRMGFVEEDDDGNMQVIVPRLTFTRLALQDNADTFDALFNLYQKGSLDIDTIYDLLNLDSVTITEKLHQHYGGIKDPNFNEVTRAMLGKVGDMLADNTDIAERVAKGLGLTYSKPKEGGERF